MKTEKKNLQTVPAQVFTAFFYALSAVISGEMMGENS